MSFQKSTLEAKPVIGDTYDSVAHLDALQLKIGRELARLATLLLEDAFGRCTHSDVCRSWALVRRFDERRGTWPDRVRFCKAHFEADRAGELDIRLRGQLRSNRQHGNGPWLLLPWFASSEDLVRQLTAWECIEDERARELERRSGRGERP